MVQSSPSSSLGSGAWAPRVWVSGVLAPRVWVEVRWHPGFGFRCVGTQGLGSGALAPRVGLSRAQFSPVRSKALKEFLGFLVSLLLMLLLIGYTGQGRLHVGQWQLRELQPAHLRGVPGLHVVPEDGLGDQVLQLPLHALHHPQVLGVFLLITTGS